MGTDGNFWESSSLHLDLQMVELPEKMNSLNFGHWAGTQPLPYPLASTLQKIGGLKGSSSPGIAAQDSGDIPIPGGI